jgi:hypothetical protein
MLPVLVWAGVESLTDVVIPSWYLYLRIFVKILSITGFERRGFLKVITS